MGFEVRQVGGFAYSAHIVLKFLWTLCGVVFGLTAWGGLCFGKEKMRTIVQLVSNGQICLR